MLWNILTVIPTGVVVVVVLLIIIIIIIIIIIVPCEFFSLILAASLSLEFE